MKIKIEPLFVSAISKFHQQTLGTAVQSFPVEQMNDVFALLFTLHPRETHASALHVRVAEDARRDDAAMLRQHILQIRFGHVRRKVRYVQVRGIRLDLTVEALRGRHLYHVTRRHHDSTHQPLRDKQHIDSRPAERAHQSVSYPMQYLAKQPQQPDPSTA